ncbi:hypothetical protein [Roseibium sp.]|uniref:hypothetical protein n=1 Tax=Roseibium sp. TaxID=1936156 RepID=UPI003D11CF58
MSSFTSQNNDITLTAQLVEDGRTLRLSYRVTNTSGRTVYLFDVLHGDYDGSVYPLIEPNYATIEQGQLVLSRQIIPVPEFTLVESVNTPFVTSIPPGRSVEKTVAQVQPIYPWTPYTRNEGIPPASGTLRMNAYFRIGYFLGVEGTSDLAKPVQTDQGTFASFNPFPVESQKTLMVGPLGTAEVYDVS